MKNPFQNTKDYMIVRQVQRLSNKKRSYSNSSNSSIGSSESSKYLNNPGYGCTPNYRARANREYLFDQPRTSVYQVQKKRAELFGVQQLRYRPAYFDSLNMSKEKQQKILESQKPFKANTLKSQRSVKFMKFADPTLEPITEKVKDSQNLKRLSANSDNKRSSFLQQMIELNVNTNLGRLNQFYASAMDLRSRVELLKQSRQNQIIPSLKRRNRKSSIYDNKKTLIKGVQRFQQEIDSSIDDFVESSHSQYSYQRKIRLKLVQSPNNPPQITVRNKIYYKWDKNKYW